MVVDYDWYTVVNGADLQQGDFIFDLDVPVVSETKEDETPVKVEVYDAIVITQSCDIPKEAIEHIILCPVWDIEEAVKFNPQFGYGTYLERVRKGQVFAFHLLNKCEIEGYKRNCMVVQFERIIVRPKSAILEVLASTENHLRLLPPYREEMAQRFGIFFSRVAKPIEVPNFI